MRGIDWCACVVLVAFGLSAAGVARAQDLAAIDARSEEVRTLQKLACPAAGRGTDANRVKDYQEKLGQAAGELRSQLDALRRQVQSSDLFTAVLRDSLGKTLKDQLDALDDKKKVCDAAADFAKLKPATPAAGETKLEVAVVPNQLLFADKEGGTPDDASVSITNKTQQVITIAPSKIEDCQDAKAGCRTGNADEFEIKKTTESDGDCTKPLAPTDHCHVTVSFKRKTAGLTAATLILVVKDSSGKAIPGVGPVQLSGRAHVENVARIRSDGSNFSHPSFRSVLGVDVSGATSASTEQKLFVEFNLAAPLGPAGTVCANDDHQVPTDPAKRKACTDAGFHRTDRVDPLNHRLWLFLNPRITSVPQPASALTSLNAQGLGDLLSGKKTDLVQGLDVQGGFEFYLFKPRTGIPFFSTTKNYYTRLGVAFVTGVGSSTPFTTAAKDTTVFKLDPNSPLRKQFPILDPSTGMVGPIPASFTDIAFVNRERSRFYRKFYLGFRLKSYYFSDMVKGDCDADYTRPCHGVYGGYPGVIDLTFGEDEQVTGGHFGPWVFRLEAIYPLPFFPGFTIFGSVNSAMQKNTSTNALILPPTSTTAISDSHVAIINVDPRNRDIYRIGLGVDLVQAVKKIHPASNQDQQKPDAKKDNKAGTTPSGGTGKPSDTSQPANPNKKDKDKDKNGTKPPPEQGGR